MYCIVCACRVPVNAMHRSACNCHMDIHENACAFPFAQSSPVCADTQPHTATKYVRIIHARAHAHTHKKYTKTKARVEWTNVCVATVLVRSQSRVVFGWLSARKYESACNKLLHFCCQSLSTSETLTTKNTPFVCRSVITEKWSAMSEIIALRRGGRH